MEDPIQKLSGTKLDTFAGTIFAVFFCVNIQEILNTALMATVGAIVSFCVSLALRKIDKWFKKW
ncbi:MAG: hypothetical protein Q8K92_09045 [Leadbetterella sp.]|nr:hypothetical protein [Leadbetterella sp.]